MKENYYLLVPAVRLLGIRVAVSTCRVHVAELYSYMEIDCPSNLSTTSHFLLLHPKFLCVIYAHNMSLTLGE